MPLAGKAGFNLRVGWALMLVLGLLLSRGGPVYAGTLVRVSTTVGDFTIDLLDDTAPITVQNFLNYVARGDYNQTYIHRSEDNFVVQGGGYKFVPFVGPVDVPHDPPIPNEFGASNVRGTVAMAKFFGNPDSATSEWFVNVADNSAELDVNNGGFTVFGVVLGNGMNAIDAIDSLFTINLGAKASSAPIVTSAYESPLDFVYVNMEVVDRFSEATNVYEAARQLLITSVNVDNGAEYYSVNFRVYDDGTDTIAEINPDSVVKLLGPPGGVASFSTTTNKLQIPLLEINDGGNISSLNNLVFGRIDSTSLRFRLESIDE